MKMTNKILCKFLYKFLKIPSIYRFTKLLPGYIINLHNILKITKVL